MVTMRRIRLLTVVLLALLTVGIVSASSASAAFKLEAKACTAPGKPAFCWEASLAGVGLQELVGEEKFTIEQLATPEPLFEAEFGGTIGNMHILCTAASGTGTMLQNNPLVEGTTGEKLTVTLTGCKLLAPLGEKCKVEETLPIAELTASAETVSDLVVKPTVGTTFFELDFLNITEGSCPAAIRGKVPVKGKAECLWLAEASLVDLPGQECEFIHTDKGLELGANPATLEAEFEIKFPILEQTDFWDVVEA
jgi:hypothetical protein